MRDPGSPPTSAAPLNRSGGQNRQDGQGGQPTYPTISLMECPAVGRTPCAASASRALPQRRSSR